MVDAPTVLISWSHVEPGADLEAQANRREKVLALANALRAARIDAEVDLYHHNEGVDWSRWGPALVSSSDYVVVVQSEAWAAAWLGTAPPTAGAGAAAEADVLRSIYQRDRDEFVKRVRLVGLPGEAAPVPDGLGNVTRYRLTTLDEDGIEDIIRDLTGQPRIMKPALGPPRHLPSTPPPAVFPVPDAVSAPPVSYSPLSESLPVEWRSDWDPSSSQLSAVAVHAFRLTLQRQSARAMGEEARRIGPALRARGVVPDNAPISTQPTNDSFVVLTDPPRWQRQDVVLSQFLGARLGSSGQFSCWRSLPTDSMGAVLDRDDVTEAIVIAMNLAAAVWSTNNVDVAVALELNGITTITGGRITDLGRRRSASLPGAMRQECRVNPDETIHIEDVTQQAPEIAKPLAAVLLERWE